MMANPTMNDTQYDLSTCEKEPIHKLGRIQSFGYLLCFNSDWGLTAYSENAPALLDKKSEHFLGEPLEALVNETAVTQIKEAVSRINMTDQSERLSACRLFKGKTLYDVAVHFSGTSIIVEFEPSSTSETDHIQTLKTMLTAISQSDDLTELLQSAAQHMAMITGFDRVMVYRFHDDDSGEVIAEHRNSTIDSFMGLRYPASDIPKQARALYLRNLTRLIADVSDGGVAILPNTSQLDLSISATRAVSPIHLEYLRNMKIGASMSVSIVVDGKLWGLFACHHNSTKYLPLQVRTIAELYAEAFSLELRVKLNAQSHSDGEASRKLHMKLVTSLNNELSLFDNLKMHVSFMQKLIPSDSLVLVVAGQHQVAGDPISSEDVNLLVRRLNRTSNSGIFSVESLSEWLEDDLTIADRFSGMLVIPMSRRPRDLLIYLRKEEPQKVQWAGNPEKPVELGPNGVRLTPRKSFEAWIEMRRGYSAPWSDQEKAVAEQIKTVLLEVIVRNLDDYNRVANDAQRQKDMLIHELNHRVRNILGLISGIVSQTSTDRLDINDFKDVLGGRVQALALAQTHLTERNWQHAPLQSIIDTEVSALISRQNAISVSGPEVHLSPKAFTTLTMVIHELLTNSVKYGAAKTDNGQITLNWAVHKGDLHLYWRESGVTIEKPPARSGFGSVIISRSVPHDLGGSATLEYQRSGVVAEFVVPSNHFEFLDDEITNNPMDNNATNRVNSQPVEGRALIVEDNMIIGFELERTLEQLGYENIGLTATVKEALQSIESTPPSFAILDINLGNESSEAVADRLSLMKIPFIFATGYSAISDDFKKKFTNIPIVEKPYGSASIKAALSLVIQ